MNTTFLYFAVIGDLAYDISRFTLRFASVLFLAYVLTIAMSLLLTWRPKLQTIAVAIEKPSPQAVVKPQRVLHRAVAPHSIGKEIPARLTPLGTTRLPRLPESQTINGSNRAIGDGKFEVGR